MNSAGSIWTGPMRAQGTRLATATGNAFPSVQATIMPTPTANPTNTIIEVIEAPSFFDTLPETRLITATIIAKTDSNVAASEADNPLPTKK